MFFETVHSNISTMNEQLDLERPTADWRFCDIISDGYLGATLSCRRVIDSMICSHTGIDKKKAME